MTQKLFDSAANPLIADLKANLAPGATLSIIAPRFSLFGLAALKKELAQIASLRFIFSAPAFRQAPKSRPEEYLPRLARERALYGPDYEAAERRKLMQKALASELAAILAQKAVFKSNATTDNMPGFAHIASGEAQAAYLPLTGLTTGDIGLRRGDNAYCATMRAEGEVASQLASLFNSAWTDCARCEDVTQTVFKTLQRLYSENAPELVYFLILHSLFSDSADERPDDASGFRETAIWQKLYDFQKDAALGLIAKLGKFNGCILADSVGLGKTFTALAVIKYYECRNKNVLVLCPKKIYGNWSAWKANYEGNPLAGDRLRYDILYHTDLSRNGGFSNGLDLDRLNWSNYDLVVIDESHNFRNGGQMGKSGQENRYQRLLSRVIRPGVRTKVLMLSATPVNNRFHDLRNQLALACENDPAQWKGKLKAGKGLDEIFRSAQRAFNAWQKLPQEDRSVSSLLSQLDPDFFELLDSATIARSRRHIEKYYDISGPGAFPERLAPLSVRSRLTDLPGIAYSRIANALERLNLEVYAPSLYIFKSRLAAYENGNLTQAGRETGLKRLMAINLLKRLESSVHAFRLTISRVLNLLGAAISACDSYENSRLEISLDNIESEFDLDDLNLDFLNQAQKIGANLADIDYVSWRERMKADQAILKDLLALIEPVDAAADAKLQALLEIIAAKQANPINPGNKKLLIFTAFADTAEYLYANIAPFAQEKFGVHTALITGASGGKTTLPGIRRDMAAILGRFAPKAREDRHPEAGDIDILIATDCLSEGQNLQDCDIAINYDIHWNPVRLIQRFGRIDRIGSPNERIRMINFWPDLTLDEYIDLKGRVESRMKATVLAATGDDDLLDEEERGDLEYRKRQLERLREASPNLEDLAGGLSITDFGLNEYRQDLLALQKRLPDADMIPPGIYAVASAAPDLPPGIIFALRSLKKDYSGPNRMHPWYLVYLREDGQTHIGHLDQVALLRALKSLCMDRREPDPELCALVNRQTRSGKNMKAYRQLLDRAVEAIIGAKEQSDIDSLFRPGGTNALRDRIAGIEEFDLLCFLIIK